MKSDTCLPTPETVRQRNVDTCFDAAGRLLYARCKEKTIMDRCVEIGYLDHHHAEYAMLYLGLRLAWLAPVAYKQSSLCREVDSYFDGTGIIPSNLYDAVYSLLGGDNSAIVVYAATCIWTKESPPVAAITGEVCLKSFDRMVSALDETRNEFKKVLGA